MKLEKAIFVTIAMFCTQGFAQQGMNAENYGLYDFVAPSVYGTPSQPVVGHIYYDTQSGSFKGVNGSGSSVALSVANGNTVTSNGSNERVERLKVATTCTSSPCTITSQSNGWVSSVTRSGIGAYTVNFTGGTFSAAPSCVVWAANGSGNIGFSNVSTMNNSSSSWSFNTATSAAAVDAGFDIICMGPK